jgi:hypothetical protein
MLPPNGVHLAEIDQDNLFSVEVCRQLSLLFITPVHYFREYLGLSGQQTISCQFTERGNTL